MSTGLSSHKIRIIYHLILIGYETEEEMLLLQSAFSSYYRFRTNDRKSNIGKLLLPKANITINILKSSTVNDTTL